jgi:UDP:flavonoid glycosyltransferase YjiC (YdhE family)
MPIPAFDIVVLADWRRADAVFWYQRNLTEAALKAGYRLAVMQIDGGHGETRLGFRPWLREMISRGEITWLEPMADATAALSLTVDSTLIEWPLNRPIRLRADLNLVIITGDGGVGHEAGAPHSLPERLSAQFRGPVQLAAATDLILAELASSVENDNVSDLIWRPAVDLDGQAAKDADAPASHPLIVGAQIETADQLDHRLFGWRHRPLKLRGPRADLLAGQHRWPPVWQISDAASQSTHAFCRNLDVYLEGFEPGRGGDALCAGAIMTAASGGLVLASPRLDPYLGELAIVSDAFTRTIDDLSDDKAFIGQARKRASEALRARHDLRCHQERLTGLIGRPQPFRVQLGDRPRMPKRRALFFSTNGVGMGHLTRQLAIARRLPPSIEPVFLSMSQACGQIEKFGFAVEYTPYHQYYAGNVDHWNKHLNHLLNEMIAFYDPSVLVFDGNYPFRALVDVSGQNPGRPFVWCRRGLWRSGQNPRALARSEAFDLVIEPLDLATAFDHGPTKAEQTSVRCIPPIRLLKADEIDDREAAAAALGLDPAKPAVLLQLGSRNNYDLAPLVDRLLPALRAIDGLQIATLQWLISEKDQGWPDDVRVLTGYPMGRYFAAFDFSIATPGYNSFHELVAHAMPAIFVPNENASMDDHVARAAFAERQGFGFSLRRAEVYKIAAVVEAIGKPDVRARMREAAKAHASPNGAGMAAEALEELVYSARQLKAPLDADVHRRIAI